MGKKLIITAALCGAGTTKKQTPCVPITPEEIAADANSFTGRYLKKLLER